MPTDLRRLVPAAFVLAAVAVMLGDSTAGFARDSLPGPIPAAVTEVIDGDTLAVRAVIWLGQEIETHVRLTGVDAPERRGKCSREKEMAEQARAMVVQLVADDRVRLYDIQADKYGNRVRARVVAGDGTDIAGYLIAAGLARPYAGGTRQPWCSVAER